MTYGMCSERCLVRGKRLTGVSCRDYLYVVNIRTFILRVSI